MKIDNYYVESLKNYIRSDYDLGDEYIDDERGLMRDFEFGDIDEEEFETRLREVYESYSKVVEVETNEA